LSFIGRLRTGVACCGEIMVVLCGKRGAIMTDNPQRVALNAGRSSAMTTFRGGERAG